MKIQFCNPRRLIISLALFGLLSSLAAKAATVNVDIQNFAFIPPTVTINAGDSVIWTQRDTTTHTATSDLTTGPGVFNSGNLTPLKPKYTNTFNTAGTFKYHCIPHSLQMKGTVIVQAAANTPPTVSITSPTNGTVFTVGDNITINATATDSDGTVATVDFLEGINLLGTAASPFSFIWSNVAAGSYTLTAVATDDLSAKGTSAPVTINVVPAANVPPTVSITSPTNGTVFAAGANITINATAADSDGTVSAVEFREGANLLGAAASSPYSLIWSNVAAGNYTLTADATDNLSAKATSAPVTISVVAASNAPPTVSITSPVNGDAFAAGTNITIIAVAADSDGTIASVEFHEGTNVLGTATSSPYSFTWNNVAAGTYTLTAEATDNLGQKTTSGPVTITVSVGSSGPINITTALATTNALTLTWTGGTAPYLVQMKSNISDTNWFDVMTTTNQGAIVARVGSQAFFQISDQASTTVTAFTVAMNGAAERLTPVTTTASGLGILSLKGNILSYLISFAGLSGPATAAHIHGPATTTNAVGVMVTFTNIAAAVSGTIQGTLDVTTLSADQLSALKTGRTYANIHTVANTGGEIRGQISPVHFTAVLSGAAEVPPVTTAASGTGSFDLVGDQLFYTVIYSGLSAAAIAAHIHAPIGADGKAPVLIPFTAPSGTSGTISGVASLNPDQFATFVDAANAGGAYANVHTGTNPGGEIRGTLTSQ